MAARPGTLVSAGGEPFNNLLEVRYNGEYSVLAPTAS